MSVNSMMLMLNWVGTELGMGWLRVGWLWLLGFILFIIIIMLCYTEIMLALCYCLLL